MQMLDMYERSEKKTARPNRETFRIVLKAYANLGGARWEGEGQNYINAVDAIEGILVDWREFELKDGHQYEKELNTEILNLALKAYARCGRQEIPDKSIQSDSLISSGLPWLENSSSRGTYAERAEKLLLYMMEHVEYLPHIAPDARSYGYVVEAWSRQQPSAKTYMSERGRNGLSSNHVCVTRASRWLSYIELFYKQQMDADDKADILMRRIARRTLIWSYSDVLDSWARSGVPQAARQASTYMSKIEKLSEEDIADVELLKNTVPNDGNNGDVKNESWEGTNDNSLDQTPIQLFDEKENFLHPSCVIYPSDQTYTSAILAVSKSTESGAAARAHQLLNRMLKLYESGQWGRNRPTLIAFNSVISAYARSPQFGSAGKAEAILDQLESLYFGEKRSHYAFLKPDVVTYNAVITAWSKCREEAAVFKAENIVKRMETHYQAVGDKFLNVRPDAYTYCSLINSWIRSGLGITSAQNAETLLRSMVEKFYRGEKQFLPDQKTFSQIIHAWGCCTTGDDLPVKRAMSLLSLMEQMAGEGADGLKPDIITYSSLIDTVAKNRSRNSFDLALTLLDRIENLYEAGDRNMKPNARTFSSVFDCLLYSEQNNKHSTAEKLLHRMNKLGVEPNAFTYNYVIHCAASEVEGDESSKIEAFKVALRAFTSLRRSKYETDSFTYNFFLKACTMLPPSSTRFKIVSEVFRECCDQGKLSNEVLSRLRHCLELSDLRSLLSGMHDVGNDLRSVSVADLNPNWSFRAS